MLFKPKKPEELMELLKTFQVAQCQLRIRRNETYRGVVKSITVYPPQQKIRIRFYFLCILRPVTYHDITKDFIWKLRTDCKPGYYIDFDYRHFYYQPDEQRIKIDGFGEVCHFYLTDDHTNIYQVEEENYASYLKTHLNLQLIVWALIKKELKI
jgi:hypothetical protein